MTVYDEPVPYRPLRGMADVDPIEEAASYVNHKWFQTLVPVKTECYCCHATSPVIHVHYGAVAFGNPRMLRKGKGSFKERDITDEVKIEFANHGWKFQLRRSYCPKCKNLGSA